MFDLGDIADQEAFRREWLADHADLGCHPELIERERRLQQRAAWAARQRRRRADPATKAKINADHAARRRRRYASDPDYRAARIAANRQRRQDPAVWAARLADDARYRRRLAAAGRTRTRRRRGG